MSENVINLGAAEKARAESEAYIQSLFGPQSAGQALIVDGRCIPNITIRECGDMIEFVLDSRLGFEFPRELAGQAASFAANAMAIGAGYASLNSESKERPFAPQCFGIDFGDLK